MYVYIYIYIYIYLSIYLSIKAETVQLVGTADLRALEVTGATCEMTRKGTNGVGTDGVTASLQLFDSGTFWVLQLTYFYLPKSARAYLFPEYVKMHYFCSGPMNVDPICPQPNDSCASACQFLVLLTKLLQLSPPDFLRLFLDPMRSSRFSHWRLWIRA